MNTEMAKTVTLGSANPPDSNEFRRGQNSLYLSGRRHGQKMLKNVRWSPLNTEMAKTVSSDSANPYTVTNFGVEGGRVVSRAGLFGSGSGRV